MGIVPAERARRRVLDHLVANLQANGYHLNLGEIGLPALFDVLSAAGRHDVIYQIATQTTAPSYGAMLARGATSLTEFWDGSGSQNHFMLGAIDKWFTSGLAGIGQAPSRPASRPGDRAGIRRRPDPCARGRYETPNGKCVASGSGRASRCRWRSRCRSIARQRSGCRAKPTTGCRRAFINSRRQCATERSIDPDRSTDPDRPGLARAGPDNRR